MKPKAYVNVYLFLLKDSKVLLSLRQNTGYEDHNWAPVSGNQELGESAMQAMIREAKEEIGVEIAEDNLRVVHTMHRKTNRENVDIFMMCSEWKGAIVNKEPHKCAGLEFYALNQLPSNIVNYVEVALKMWFSSKFYSELGWGIAE